MIILLHCLHTEPTKLWETYKSFLCEDILYQFKIDKNNSNFEFNQEVSDIGLSFIYKILKNNGKNYPILQACLLIN